MQNAKEIYIKWANNQIGLPLFFYPWWLDIVCESHRWEVALVKEREQVVGILPYCIKKYWGQTTLGLPKLTPFLGPLLFPQDGLKRPQYYAFEKRVMQKLIDQLPDYLWYRQKWTPEMLNWLPFYWNGFEQSTFYTYILEDISSPSKVYDQFKPSVRNSIKTAKENYELSQSDDIDLFYQLNSYAFKAKQPSIPYSLTLLKNIKEELEKRSWIKIYLAENKSSGKAAAGILVVRDVKKCYLLATGRLPQSQSGAIALLIWQAIQDYSEDGVQFDFEGSIIPGIESFFRGFGGKMVPYYLVSKWKYKWLKALKTLV